MSTNELNLNGDPVEDHDDPNVVTAIKEEPAPEIAAEPADVKDSLIAIEHQITDGEKLIDTIRQTRGMSQTFALEADQIFPGFISDETPLAYYTRMATATLLGTTLSKLERSVANAKQVLNQLKR